MIERREQKTDETWDLTRLYKTTDEWYKSFSKLQKLVKKTKSFKEKLSDSSSLFSALSHIEKISFEAERLAEYSFLSYEQDESDPAAQKMYGEFLNFLAVFSESVSWITPEIVAIDDQKINLYLKEKRFSPYKRYIKTLIRTKKHILSEREERLISLFSLVKGNAEKVFSDLNNIELNFGEIDGKTITHSNFPVFIRAAKADVRKESYIKYYSAYDEHKNTLSSLLSSSVNEDIFVCKARGFSSCLESSLYPDAIPSAVYYSLISAVRENLEILHKYYSVKSKTLKKKTLNHYDVYLPLVSGVQSNKSYSEAVKIIGEAVRPLGDEYRETLIKGLTTERWVDIYANKGKRSGAFSSGSYGSLPYILTNYEEDILDSVYTLIHEGGHSMHTLYASRNNPFMSYNYSIFEAEVASTFNENLLSHYLLSTSKNDKEKLYILGKNLDDIVATLFRQTMFAEFELKIHKAAENGEALTSDSMRSMYRELLSSYFGETVKFLPLSDLEFLRVPHFYSSFYCFKYATGISASIALSKKVLEGGKKERDDYISFLKTGGSKYPIDALKTAGVDMSKKETVVNAINHFAFLLDNFISLSGM